MQYALMLVSVGGVMSLAGWRIVLSRVGDCLRGVVLYKLGVCL